MHIIKALKFVGSKFLLLALRFGSQNVRTFGEICLMFNIKGMRVQMT